MPPARLREATKSCWTWAWWVEGGGAGGGQGAIPGGIGKGNGCQRDSIEGGQEGEGTVALHVESADRIGAWGGAGIEDDGGGDGGAVDGSDGEGIAHVEVEIV